MGIQPVVIIAFKEFDNLGAGYLASALSEEGFHTEIVDFRKEKEEILDQIIKLQPLVVGFSVIFQFYIDDFRDLIAYLRKAGIKAHFCAGGQYASMRYEDLFRFIPELDSIIRFEGEYAFVELVKSVVSASEWRNIKSLVYRDNGKIIVNPTRRPEEDIDKFPFPFRAPPEEYAFGHKSTTIIAGRGCIHNCSFCNNTEYMRQSGVTGKRLRKPEKVVEEMEFLHRNKDCSVFLFEDDDFPVKSHGEESWTENFCSKLRERKLKGRIIWKINCRPDEIDEEKFAVMKGNGLFLVFLGLDDGTDSGLKALNKHMTIEESLEGIDILKKLDIGFDYGFMLFQPASTFSSVRSNILFLRKICGDGVSPVTFLKLLPFFDTKTERELMKEGRLKGKPGYYDYDYTDSSFNKYYSFIEEYMSEWMHDPDGLANMIKWGRNYFSAFRFFYDITPEVQALENEFRLIVVNSNKYILDTMDELSELFENPADKDSDLGQLALRSKNIKSEHDRFKAKVLKIIVKLTKIAEYQKIMRFVRI